MGKVRTVYLVSADRKARTDYKNAIAYAIGDVRWWYKQKLGGTFTWAGSVEVAQSDKNASWFGTNNAASLGDDAYYENVLAETSHLLKVRRDDANWVWVIYCDGPGNKGRGGNGVCIMPEDDLLGLTGAHPTQRRIERWRGGLAHELGHALGLPHPPTERTTASTDGNSIMWLGYTKYPSTYFTEADKKILANSSFIYGMKKSG